MPSCFEEAWISINAVVSSEHSVSYAEARLLYLLGCYTILPIVELGSYQGRSTAFLAYSSSQIVYAVDEFFPEVFDTTIASLDLKNVVKVCGDTLRCSFLKKLPDSIGVLWIDSLHTYRGVIVPVEVLWPRVDYIVLHDVWDSRYPGVTRAANELEQRMRVIARIGSILCLRKR